MTALHRNKPPRRTALVVFSRCALVLAGLLGGLAAGELGLRVLGYQKPPYSEILVPVRDDRHRPHALRPHAQGRVEGTYVRINSRGLRDREYGPKREGALRIFVLGRCVTFGHGLALEDAFVKRLEVGLNALPAAKGGTAFEVVNGGIPEGHRSTQGLVRFFQTEGSRYDPDLLVLEWGLRPMRWQEVRRRQPLWARIIANDVAPKMPRSMLLTWYLYEKAAGYRWEDYWEQALAEKGEIQRLRERYEPSGAFWKDEEAALTELLRFARGRRIPVLVVVLPWMNYFDREHPFEEIYGRVLALAERHGAKTLSLLPEFMGRAPQPLWLDPGDRRPNAAAHAVIERAIRRFLTRKNLLARPGRAGARFAPYEGRLFDAMSQWNAADAGFNEALGTARDAGVEDLALVERGPGQGPSAREALEARSREAGFAVLGTPKYFRFAEEFNAENMRELARLLGTGRYAFVGEVIYRHALKSFQFESAGSPPVAAQMTRDRHLDPLDPRSLALMDAVRPYHLPLVFHWEFFRWEEDYPRFAELFRAYPDQIFILSHMGFGSPGQVGKLLAEFPNLYVTTSKRYKPYVWFRDPAVKALLSDSLLDDSDILKPEWKDLLVRFSGRFLFAVDAHNPQTWAAYRESVGFARAMLGQLPPRTAEAIAYRNALRLYRGSRAR